MPRGVNQKMKLLYLLKILSENTGKSLSQIELDVERDHFLSSYEAKEYGLIDNVISKKK